ncbi:MAG: DUF4011 domain-containing protein [Methanobrevibacter woesei]|uniref:DUF4011 domain-containing protein n=1 Tax=Methanobrevibacter woesei TaxID=190976 RepID=UPI0023F51D49|nr:DUF4011 domain-containing protein [Methanobrevibacter woesei]MCI7291293.1 DUF4011 domain-containing protein [Methanobrevibacter woesei]
MAESIKNILKIDDLSSKLCNLETFLNFKWDNYSVPVIDADFFDLFSRLVINHEIFEFSYELSKSEIEELIDGEVTNRSELDKLNKTLLRIDELKPEEYFSQNTLAIFKNPKFYIPRLNESVLHTPLSKDDLNIHLNSINLKNKKILYENGLANLYLTFGFYTSDEFNAPLIFIPVKLEKNSDKFELTYDSHDKIRLNTPLKLKLEEKGIDLPQTEIKSETDMISYLTKVNKLGNIKTFISLGLFDFSTSLVFDDLNKFKDSIELNDLLNDSDKTIQFNESEIDLIDEKDSYNILDADSSQISAIREALLDGNLFIDAPSGSKKIDTVVNLISEIIANKKTVLYISDKIDAIHKTEDKLSEIGLENVFINLYGNNYNYQSFIEEITSTSELNPELDYNADYINDKLNELNDLKGKLADYSNFMKTPYKNTGLTPYHLIGVMENEYDDKLDEFEMKNISNLTNDEYNGIISDFKELSELYINKIHPVSKNKFNYIVAKDIGDDDADNIFTTIPKLKRNLEQLIELNTNLNKEFGVKKLEKINDYKNHFEKLDILKNNPKLMNEDYVDLKKYVDALDSFQAKTREYGSIEDLEKLLLVEVYNSQIDLENQFKELNKLNRNITQLNDLFDEFKSKVSDAGIKNLNSIKEIEKVINSLDLLDKNPAIILDEEKINVFVEDIEKYQNKCKINSPEDLLKNIDKYSKETLNSTIKKIDSLIGYKESIEDVNASIADLNDLKIEIGLNEFHSIDKLNDDLKKVDILLTNPVLVDDENVIDEFINKFEVGANKFAKNDYEYYHSNMNDEIEKIQNNISDEISKTEVLETNIPTIKNEVEHIFENANKLSQLLNIKKINSIKEIDEYCDNVEILLKNPIIIESNDKNRIDAYISLIDDVQKEKEYTKLDIDEVNKLITEIISFNKKFAETHFENQVLYSDLNKCSQIISDCEEKLATSPINPKLNYDFLNKKFAIFSDEYNKLLKTFSGTYKTIKKELKSYYRYNAPKEDGIIYDDFKNHLKILEKLENAKKSVLKFYKLNQSMETNEFKEELNDLIDLQREYNNLKDELSSKFNILAFENALDYLVSIKLKLIDINKLYNNEDNDSKLKKIISFRSKDKKTDINSQLKKYFPKTYFNIETNLEELYEEYNINEEYRKLVESKFFSNNSLNKCNRNKNEIKLILENIKQSKSKFYYYLNLIGTNIDIDNTYLDLSVTCQSQFNDLIQYFDDLASEINKANELFNNIHGNYKIDEIDEIIERYGELNRLDKVKEFITINTYEKTLIKYADDFNLLTEFNNLGDENSALINKYFANIWKGRLTLLNDLNESFNNHKEFTKLYDDEFFSPDIFTFLEKSNEEIKSKINELTLKCGEISQKTNNFDGQLVFYGSDLEKIDFEEYTNQNNNILKTIDSLNNYNSIFNNYNDNLIDFSNKANFESIDLINQLYKDLNKLYNDSEVLKYNISFESQIDNLNKITENKNNFIDLVRLRNSIESQNSIIQNHFDKIWVDSTTDLSSIKNKVAIDKAFTKDYNKVVFSDKTVDLINNDEHSFDNYKMEFTNLFNKIINQISKISSSPIILNEFGNELEGLEFSLISQKTFEIQNNINKLDSNYNNLKLSKTFNLDEITADINILDEIIQSEYIGYLDENVDNLVKLNNELELSLNKYNKLISLKNSFDEIDIDSKYFEDIYDGYETSVSDLNQQLEYNKIYEDLFNSGFFSNKTNDTIKDKSKLNELFELISKMENYIEYSISSFKIIDLIHVENDIFIYKSVDDILNYVTFLDSNISQLKDWIEFEKLSKNLDNDICHEFVNVLYNDEIKPELINQTFSYNLVRNLINEIRRDYTFITQSDIDKYVNLDKEVINLNRLRVLNEYINSKPDFEDMNSQDLNLMKQYKAYSHFDDLRLKTNGNIKELIDKSIDYIKSIKPIFITTPSSVFKYLSSCDFDYVIFNDVNQIQTEMAITTLLRADKKVIIADSKQSDMGLISLMKDKFKTKSLKWCYNAKNTTFCNDEILFYPRQGEESSFEIVNVENSVYNISSQINELEAEKVVELAINHVKKYGFNKSLGIIAFTKAQRDYIIKLLLDKLQNLPDLIKYFNPLDSFYVKYIDDVYESRDIILASLTYGFDEDNILNTNFESENKFIFNKLMTKSFEKTIVLANFKLEDIVENNMLKSLFKYEQTDVTEEFELSLFEKIIYNFLNNNEFNVKKQLIDFTVNNEISVECEGENFNKFTDVRDKFRLHKTLLESLGWKSLHICPSDWIDNRVDYQNNLLELITDFEFEMDEDNLFDDDFEFDFENDEEITVNELKELL